MTNPPGPPPLRAVVIGLGESAWRIQIPAVRSIPGAVLVGAADIDPGRRAAARRNGLIPVIDADPLEMLRRLRPDIVLVATPPQTHFELCRAALELGCHVFCEKPFTLTLAEADDLVGLSRRQGRLIAVNHQYDQMPIFKEALNRLKAGSVGGLYSVEAWQHMHLPPWSEQGWKKDLMPRRVLLEFGGHVIDLICRFFDAFPSAVSAQIAQLDLQDRTDACVVMRLDFPGGRFGNLIFNRLSQAPVKYLEMLLNGEREALRISYGGLARFSLEWNAGNVWPRPRLSFTRGGELRLETHGERSRHLVSQLRTAIAGATRAHLQQFIRAITAGESPLMPAERARAILEVVLAGYRSIDSGGELVPIEIDRSDARR